jgi:hypothetical protein
LRRLTPLAMPAFLPSSGGAALDDLTGSLMASAACGSWLLGVALR